MDFNSGGKKVIERLVEAYGFTTRQALCDHLGVSKSTMATRYMRDIFPADWVLRCALETDTSLEWLALGTAQFTKQKSSSIETMPCYDLCKGQLINEKNYSIEKDLLPKELIQGFIVNYGFDSYILSKEKTITNGIWLISIDDEHSFRNIFKLPNNRVRVENEQYNFECEINDLGINSKVKTIIKRGL